MAKTQNKTPEPDKAEVVKSQSLTCEVIGYVNWISNEVSKTGKTKRIGVSEGKDRPLTYISIPVSMVGQLQKGQRVRLSGISKGTFNAKVYLNLSEKYGKIEVL